MFQRSTKSTLFEFQFAELESLLGDLERARAIYELAISQPRLDMPELVWKAYIDFEVGQGERDKVRELHERLLERTMHVKVRYSYERLLERTMHVKVTYSFPTSSQGSRVLSKKRSRAQYLENGLEF